MRRSKILRLKKFVLEGFAESLKQHYSGVRDFGQARAMKELEKHSKTSYAQLSKLDPSSDVKHFSPQTPWLIAKTITCLRALIHG